MKRINIIFLFLFALLSCTHKDVSYYDNGNPKHILIYKGKKLNGEQKWFYENGNLQSVFNYQSGIPEGASAEYNINGTKKSESNFQDGKLNGIKKTYDDNGNLVSIETYEENKKNGIYKKWHRNQKPMIEGYFKEDQFDSSWRYFDQFGIIIAKGEFVKGKGKLTSWFPNGNIMRSTLYKNSIKNGKEHIYDKNGKLISELYYLNGEILK